MSEVCINESCEDCRGPEWRECVTRQLEDGRERMAKMEEHIKINTDAIMTVKSDTSELIEILHAVKGGLKVLSALGVALKWAAGVTAAAVAIWHAIGDKLRG